MFPREYRGVAGAVLLFLLIQLGSLALVQTFFEQGYQAVENPDDPTNSLLYIGAILVATLGFLAAFKYDFDWIVRVVIVATSGLLSWYVFSALMPSTVAAGLGAAVSVALWVYPEWYVVDTAGVLMGAGAAGLFGITFGLLPALVLLSVLAVYDAISVYGTEHMLDLADGVMDLRIPAILVIPLSLSYSLLDDDPETGDQVATDEDGHDDSDADEDVEDDRDVFFIGLGDAVIPGVLVASAAFFSPAPQFVVPVIELNLPALLALVGTLGGLLVLMRMVMKGRAHAGLPLLNGGAIGGYLLGSLLAGVSLVETVGLAGIV
ncbi:presenilin family intramembrane aspartyl protease PSH [Halohasta salina]|uniref:presenilin family intramembrane aspartyl protease PSH n=1 Tax=Halohasta salina TaxID=2961621 RepID=UPI0020A5A42F|nr:presenilin family intramembrane aspartyl protease PSH [Halohasta salina]